MEKYKSKLLQLEIIKILKLANKLKTMLPKIIIACILSLSVTLHTDNHLTSYP